VGKTNVWKSAWWTAWKTDVVKSAWGCVWKTNDCILGTWSQFSEKANFTLVVPFRSHFDELSQFVRFNACWQNVAIYALWLILVKCCDLRALTHVGKMPRFTHFARHKISAARRFQLFCTPAQRWKSNKILYVSQCGHQKNPLLHRFYQLLEQLHLHLSLSSVQVKIWYYVTASQIFHCKE